MTEYKKSDLYPHFSEKEYASRFEKIRNAMAKRGLDCLLIAGSSSYIGDRGAALHYVTNFTEIWGTCNYVVFPMKGDPTLLMTFGTSHMINAREVTGLKDIRTAIMGSHPEIITQRIKELKLENAKIGITECDMMHTTVPLGFYNALVKNLPNARFELVGGIFDELWEIKSTEEVKALERASELCDLAAEAAVKMVKPGVKEYEVVAAMKNAIVSQEGGDAAFVMVGSTPMSNPSLSFPNPIPSSRTIRTGDIIVNEIGARYNNYEAQSGIPIAVGRPTKEYSELWDLTLETYNRVIDCLRPGKTCEDVMKDGGAALRKKGYNVQAPLVHGLGPGWAAQPLVFLDRFFARPNFTFQPNMILAVESHPVYGGERFYETHGIYLGETYVVTQGEARCLHKYPPKFEVV